MAKWMQNPAISGDAGKVLMGDQKAALYLALNSGWAETTAPIGGVTPPPDSALDLEQVRDAIALALRGLGGITIEPDDPGDTIGIRQKNKLADLADVDQAGAAPGRVPAVSGMSGGSPTGYGLRAVAPLLTRTTTKTSAYTAVAGELVVADTTLGTFAITVPAVAASGDPVQVGVRWEAGTVPPTVQVTGGSGNFFGSGASTTATDLQPGETRVWQTEPGGGRYRSLCDNNPTAATLGTLSGRSPLAAIGKAVTGPFRTLMVGTSIANFDYSPNKVIGQALQNAYGDTGMRRFQAGALGGSNVNAIAGWQKQPFSGIFYIRARGSSSSTQITSNYLFGAGDQVVIEWSQETDAAPAEVLVDGVAVGTFGAAGPQRFGQRTVFTVARGAHSVAINPPASGYSYLEAVEIRDSSRRGIEIIDGTLGGSSLAFAATPATATGNQVAPVATAQGSGIEALFGRDDIDLIIFSFTVNDAGYNPADQTAADYRLLLEQAIVTAQRQGVPMVLQIEPAAHFALTGDANRLRYEAVKAHQLAMPAIYPHVFVADWDTATRILPTTLYASTWYPAATGVNDATGAYSGDFIHPDGTLASSSQDIGKVVLARAMRITGSVPAQKNKVAVWCALLGRAAVAIRPNSLGINNTWVARVTAAYRNPSATNLATGLNTAISGAGTSDANGKYLLASNYNWGGILSGTSNNQRMATLRIGPNDAGVLSIVASSTSLRFYDTNGNVIPTSSSGQVHMSGLPVGAVVTIGLLIDQTAASQFLTINGRVYEAAMTASAVPLLVTAPA